VVQARSLRIAGNAMDEAIMRYVRRKHHLVVGEASAERIKIEAGTALAVPNGRPVEVHIKGRDLREGRMKSLVLTQADLAEVGHELVTAFGLEPAALEALRDRTPKASPELEAA